ncbi:group 3 secretory phospholipase A2 [Engystomops pustulosus]|uniref:group 3 secretory phospholipase A2 n=1 Tax=Engystomops pustulosus TaxID=76066 RepID=UPI003AFA1A5D
MFCRNRAVVVVIYFIALHSVNGKTPKSRLRRSWIMPGTLWCGVGSIAENFTSLGVFPGVDHCCREHDQCSPYIQALEFKYGIRNYRLHTISHCDCDQRFRKCLHTLNDTVSTLVGIMFFNILEMPCFSLREEEQCVEWTWWGNCKSNGTVPQAEIHKPEIFNYSMSEDSHTSASILHHKDGQRKDSSSHTFNLISSSSLANNIKSRRRRLKKLQRKNAKLNRPSTLKVKTE